MPRPCLLPGVKTSTHSNIHMNSPASPKLADAIHIEAIPVNDKEEMYLFLDPAVPSWVIINRDGSEILRLCDGKRSPEEIAKLVNREHPDMTVKDTLQWVEPFLRQMEDKRIINAITESEGRDNSFHGLALEITKKCNLCCRHCYLDAGKPAENELSSKEIKNLIKATKEEGGISVAIGGGEPLLREDCMEIIDHALSYDLLVSLGTNATLINDALAAQLASLPIKIQISLDGATQEVHDAIRGRGSYQAAVNGIDALVQHGKAGDLVIAFTPMQGNVHEVSAIIDFARARDIPVVQYPPLTPSGRGRKNWQDLQLSSDDMLNFWRIVTQRSAELQGEMDILADCFSINIQQAGVPYQCSIGSQFRIDPGGNVYPCQCFHFGEEFLLGNIRTSSLGSMINGAKVKEIKKISRRRPGMIASCSTCRWQNYCGAGCMGNAFERTGSILNATSCEVRKRWIEGLFSTAIDTTKQIFFAKTRPENPHLQEDKS